MFGKILRKTGGKISYTRGAVGGAGLRGRILVCALLTLLAAVLVNGKPEAAGVFAVSAGGTARKIPIYSVETGEKKAALSFDAAWDDIN